MTGNEHPPSAEMRRAGAPPQNASPDHVNRPHINNMLSAVTEGSAADVVVSLPAPVRWIAIHYDDNRYAVVFDTIWRRRPFPLGVCASKAEARRLLRHVRLETGLPVYSPPYCADEHPDDPEAA